MPIQWWLGLEHGQYRWYSHNHLVSYCRPRATDGKKTKIFYLVYGEKIHIYSLQSKNMIKIFFKYYPNEQGEGEKKKEEIKGHTHAYCIKFYGK